MAWGIWLDPEVEAELKQISPANRKAIEAAFERIAEDPIGEGSALRIEPQPPAENLYGVQCGPAYIFYVVWEGWPVVTITGIAWVM